MEPSSPVADTTLPPGDWLSPLRHTRRGGANIASRTSVRVTTYERWRLRVRARDSRPWPDERVRERTLLNPDDSERSPEIRKPILSGGRPVACKNRHLTPVKFCLSQRLSWPEESQRFWHWPSTAICLCFTLASASIQGISMLGFNSGMLWRSASSN